MPEYLFNAPANFEFDVSKLTHEQRAHLVQRCVYSKANLRRLAKAGCTQCQEVLDIVRKNGRWSYPH